MKLSDRAAETYIRRWLDRLPRPIRTAVVSLRGPEKRWLRIPAAALLIAGGLLWFLPIMGFWMLPLGLLLVAEDVPPLKRWLVATFVRLGRLRKRRPGS